MVARYRLRDYVRARGKEFFSLASGKMSVRDYTREYLGRMHQVRHITHSAREEVCFYAHGLPKKYHRYLKRGTREFSSLPSVGGLKVEENRSQGRIRRRRPSELEPSG